MNKFHMIALIVALLLFSVQITYSQDADTETCVTLVRDALDLTRETCEDSTGRNQACYGNITLLVEAQPGVNDLTFAQRGDIVDVESIRTLQLSSHNSETNEWGVAYLRLQTSIEDDVPEDMTMLMFGDVTIENAVEPAPEVVTFEITSTGNINVRGGPSTNDAVVTALTSGQTVIADGRIEDGSWLRIQLEDDTFGWVFTQLMTVEGDVSTLAVVAGDEPIVPQFGPMQAFFVETGSDDAPCAEAPDSGLLIQTPEGVARIDLVVNEVEIRLRSTAYIQSQPNNEMTINMLEGSARIRTQGTRVDAEAGTRVRVPMDANNVASGPPSEPEPYDNEQIAVIPFDVLPKQFELISTTIDTTAPAGSSLADGEIPVKVGTWSLRIDVDHPDLQPCGLDVNLISTDDVELESSSMRDYVTYGLEALREGSPSITWELLNPEPNYYIIHGDGDSVDFDREYRVISPTLIESVSSSTDSNCTSYIPFIWEIDVSIDGNWIVTGFEQGCPDNPDISPNDGSDFVGLTQYFYTKEGEDAIYGEPTDDTRFFFDPFVAEPTDDGDYLLNISGFNPVSFIEYRIKLIEPGIMELTRNFDYKMTGAICYVRLTLEPES